MNGTQVFGTEADYYVAEAQRDGGDDEPDPDADPPGQGANQFTYYVTNDLAGEWRKLPDVKPKEACQRASVIVCCRSWRLGLSKGYSPGMQDPRTGLESVFNCFQRFSTVSSFDQVITHPFFDGKEEAMKDQRLRHSASRCTCVPKLRGSLQTR